MVRDNAFQAGDGKAHQVKRIETKDNNELLQLFGKFEDLNGTSVVCPVKDGVGYIIEGYADGHYFVFYAGNPRYCEIPHAQEIARAVALLPNWR